MLEKIYRTIGKPSLYRPLRVEDLVTAPPLAEWREGRLMTALPRIDEGQVESGTVIATFRASEDYGWKLCFAVYLSSNALGFYVAGPWEETNFFYRRQRDFEAPKQLIRLGHAYVAYDATQYSEVLVKCGLKM